MKIGFTCSSFDLLHAGHYLMLKDAKSKCDYLIVGLQTDPTLDLEYRLKNALVEHWTGLFINLMNSNWPSLEA